MKNYYYSDGINQNGPYTLEKLRDEKLSESTLIWFEGEESWKPLKEFTDLIKELEGYTEKPVPVPPPLPSQANEEVIPKKYRNLIFLYYWTAFHLFALLMSYSQVSFFNEGSRSQTEEFWPFVDYFHNYNSYQGIARAFNGIFYAYDWTEFLFYVGFAWIIFFINTQLKKAPNNKVDNGNNSTFFENNFLWAIIIAIIIVLFFIGISNGSLK